VTIVTTLAALAAALVAFRPGGDAPTPMGDSSPTRPRTDPSALVARMTLDEKLALMSGLVVDDRGRVELLGVGRLGVPPVLVTDGPAGVTARGVPGGATALPAPLALAATFSPSLALAYGDVLGREAAAAGAGMLFALELNLIRDPRDGRAFEKLGEDPVLAAALGAPLVRGIQRHGVIATPKRFVANDQERWRMRVRRQVGARALRELYLPPFEAALRAGAGALMAAYPVVNGGHMTANAALPGHPPSEPEVAGVIVSDYFATHATGPASAPG
jgi:beta-glucosidase